MASTGNNSSKLVSTFDLNLLQDNQTLYDNTIENFNIEFPKYAIQLSNIDKEELSDFLKFFKSKIFIMNSGLLIYNENGINIKLDKSNIPNNNNSWIIKNITISYCNTDLCDIEIDFSIQDDKIIIKSSKFSEKIKDYNEVPKIISQNKTDFHYLYNIYENLYFDEYIDIFKNYDNVDKFLKNYNRKTINNKLLQKI